MSQFDTAPVQQVEDVMAGLFFAGLKEAAEMKLSLSVVKGQSVRRLSTVGVASRIVWVVCMVGTGLRVDSNLADSRGLSMEFDSVSELE